MPASRKWAPPREGGYMHSQRPPGGSPDAGLRADDAPPAPRGKAGVVTRRQSANSESSDD